MALSESFEPTWTPLDLGARLLAWYDPSTASLLDKTGNNVTPADNGLAPVLAVADQFTFPNGTQIDWVAGTFPGDFSVFTQVFYDRASDGNDVNDGGIFGGFDTFLPFMQRNSSSDQSWRVNGENADSFNGFTTVYIDGNVPATRQHAYAMLAYTGEATFEARNLPGGTRLTLGLHPQSADFSFVGYTRDIFFIDGFLTRYERRCLSEYLSEKYDA